MRNAHSYEQILCMYKQHLLIYEKQAASGCLGTSPNGPFCWSDKFGDFIYLRDVWTSFISGRSGLHLHWGGLDFIYPGEVLTSYTLGGLDFIYLGEVSTLSWFTSGRSGLHLPRGGLDFIFTSKRSWLILPWGGLDFIYLGEVSTSFTMGRSGLHLPWGCLDFIYIREVWT